LAEWLVALYPWIKAAHIISVISWMAAMLYLPRLFVYHAQIDPQSAQSETFKVMERRLARAIMTPAMLATWVFGLALAATPGIVDWQGDTWFHIKLAFVVFLSGLHGFLSAQVRRFARNANKRSAGFFRAVNEMPTIVMIIVVVLVVVRPF
jgi:putative membrane protein